MAGDFIYSRDQFVAEHELARFIKTLAKTKVEAVPWILDGLKHKQPEAVVNACINGISTLTGPPGTGKTTTLQAVVNSYVRAGLSVLLLGPTGKAAKRADEVVNKGKSFVEKIQCSTIHTGLEYDGRLQGFAYNRKRHLPYDAVIGDEWSMAGSLLSRDFFESVKPGKTRVVLCGDPYQLPSVDPGNVLNDVRHSGIVPNVELDVVLRTGPNSGITYNANRMLRGQDISKIDPVSGEDFTDFFVVPKPSEKATVDTIVRWVSETIPQKRKLDPLKDIQVMSPGKAGITGTKHLNNLLREALNKDGAPGLCGFRLGDKVLNKKNFKQHNIVNGDMGFVKDVVRGNSGSHLTIDFGAGSGPDHDGIVHLSTEECDQMLLGYCPTIHSSQGCEFPVAIIPTHKAHHLLLTRNLVYTGLTRGKSLGMFVGDMDALLAAIKNTRCINRKTRLGSLLRAA